MKNQTTTPPAIQLKPFTVTTATQWISITLQISAAHAEYLDTRPENVRADLGSDLRHHARMVAAIITAQPADLADSLCYFQDAAALEGRLAATKSKPVTFPMLAERWNEFQAIAAQLATTPENLARAAIATRIVEIKKFESRRRVMERRVA
jgi:hypothetical protein